MSEAEQVADVIEAPAVEVKATQMPAPIAIADETQALAFADHGQLVRFINQMIKAKAIPKHLSTVEEVIAAWNYAAQLMLPPQPSLRNVAVIEGTPSLFGDLPLALVQRHKEFVFYDEFTIDDQYKRISFENQNLNAKIFGAVVFFQRLRMEKPQSFSFTWDDATRAGINREKTRNGNDTVWAKYPQDMLIRKARIRGIRALFADALSGASIAEDFGYAPDLMRDVTPAVDKAALLNEKFSTQTQHANKQEVQQ